MDTLIGVVLVLGVMILVHEWGHFIAARLCGVRVDVFSIGFGPRLFGWKRGGTDFRVSALPLGGYVRMAGQDLSEIDSGKGAPTGAPDELNSKPRWQRAIISFAGPLVNLLMPIVLLAGFFFIKGSPYPAFLDKPPVIAGMSASDPFANQGAQPGDRIVSVNGAATPTWSAADEKLTAEPATGSYTVVLDRAGTAITMHASAKDVAAAEAPGRYHPVLPIVGQLIKGEPAHRAGMKVGDEVVSVNGAPVNNWLQFVDIVKHSDGRVLVTGVRRHGELLTLKVQPHLGPDLDGKSAYKIGVGVADALSYKRMSLGSALSDAGMSTWYGTRQLVGVVGKLVTGRVSVGQFQGVVGIADMAGQAVHEGAYAVIMLMAVISLNLGILNLLPIPILDGGHLLLLAIEGIRRRDLSLGFKERFVQVGFVFLLVLFSVVMYHDLVRLLPIHS